MKTVTVIIIILFLTAAIFLGIVVLKYIGTKIFSDTETSEIEQNIPEQDIPIVVEEDGDEVEIDTEDIAAVEIYLDGNRENGIFLGEAEYGITSEEASMIYGEDFSDSGFLLSLDNNGYVFEPGSIHYLYVYTSIPKYGWDYIRKKISIPGETDYDESIQFSIDDPSHNTIIKGADKANIRISGWSVDLDHSDSTGIDKIEVYLNGPRGFGRSEGPVDYGIERSDVANAFQNANYTNSGYSLYFDGSQLEDGSENTLYVYYYSTSGTYSLAMVDFKIEGDEKESNAVISIEDYDLNDKTIEIIGWATNKDWILEGRPPRSLDIEYSTKKIVFTSNMNGNEDIFSMNIDGTELTRLTDYPGKDNYPSVSPDGKKIAYTSDINGTWQIMVMNWDGTEKAQLTHNPWRSGYPAWSFDGRFIYFEAAPEGDYEIYRINSDGSNMKRLTFNPNIDDWHPYGHPFQYKVIYESGASRNEDLYIMDYDGKNIKRISDINMRKRVPAISVDGKLIVFSDNSSVYTMDSNGENITKISGTLANCRHPDISPDNDHIIFESGAKGQEDIYIVDLDGSNPVRLTNIPGTDYDPAFMYQTP
jgi:hypothetical protein